MAAVDRWQGRNAAALIVPLTDGEAVTPHASNEFTYVSRELYIGTGGDVVVVLISGASLTYKNVPSGTRLAVRAKRVAASGTTATDILALD